MELPSGKVIFLTTDIEGSTRHWEEHPEVMTPALIRHNQLAEEVLSRHEGYLLSNRGAGDSLFMVFTSPVQALCATVELQIAYEREPWIGGISLRVRMGLHSGEVSLIDGNYYGQMVNFTIRITSLGHAGQVVLSEAMYEALQGHEYAPITLRNLGSYQQREGHDLGRIYQAVHPDFPAYFPRLRFVKPPSNNLPVRSSRFFGREPQIDYLAIALERVRLLTITGCAGIGKTRVALQVAQRMMQGEGEGIWYVDFAQPGTAEEIIAKTMGVALEGEGSLLERSLDALAPQNLLLIWDHGEEIAERNSTLVEAILSKAPQVRILACEHESLGIPGEELFALGPFELPSTTEMPTIEALTQNEAVALFVDCASTTVPAFTLDEKRLQLIATLCATLAGLPYAIELVAVRFREIDIAHPSTELPRVTSGVEKRDWTTKIADLIAWSYSLLSESEQILLCRLSVIAGTWSSEMAEHICADEQIELWEILDLIYTLDSHSLLTYEEQAGQSLYRMHESVRKFVAPHLKASGQTEKFQARYETFLRGGYTA